MALEEYRRKRDFKKTPEPPPSAAKPRHTQHSYLIQKHDATRLHYDFRLELDGVLLSWAVTKGPSLNPADKRLAVRTEDHPLSYGSFEGTIPKGEYGGGTVTLWDKGSWEPKGDPHAGLMKGHLSFTLYGERLKGGWNLVRMRAEGKRENWLLIKERDEESRRGRENTEFLEERSLSVKSERSMEQIAEGAAPASKSKTTSRSREGLARLMERFPEVQLATLVDEVPEGPAWLHEVKFDGYRLLGFLAGGVSALRTRNGKDWTEHFPSLTQALEQLKAGEAVLDMEAVVLDAVGKSSFQALQAALGGGAGAAAIVAYVFDLLCLDGDDLTTLPLTDRKAKLKELLEAADKTSALRYSDHIRGQGAALFAKSCEAGLEGIVSKQADAPYKTGRQKSWLKVKCAQRQEFIILGYSQARSGDRALGALYLAYRQEGELRYAGKVGTGFSMQSARDLTERFATLKVEDPQLARPGTALPAAEWRSIQWLKPVLLCEISFTEWTRDGRIRHPSFQGLREDKSAREVTREAAGKGLVLHGVTITHPERVLTEVGRVTKGDVAEYYAAVAPFLLADIARHPISLLRCPSGFDGECFFQRNPAKGFGKQVHPFHFKRKGKAYEYFYVEDEKGLMEVVQMGSVEIHPWGATVDAIDYPDRLVFDLDPAPDVPFEAMKLAAEDLRQRLRKKGLESVLKCTGGKGLHITVPLAGKDKWETVKSFAGSLAEEMVVEVPEAYVATMSKEKRAGRIFIDYFRNDYTATAIADYAVRARPGAPVAVPLEWKELKNLHAANQFTLRDVLKRVKGKKPAKPDGQRIPVP